MDRERATVAEARTVPEVTVRDVEREAASAARER